MLSYAENWKRLHMRKLRVSVKYEFRNILKPTLVIFFEMDFCLPESVVKKSHVTPFITSFIDPFCKRYLQGRFQADITSKNLQIICNK